MPLQQQELLQVVEQGRRNFVRSCAVHSPLPTAHFQQSPEGAITYASGIANPFCNGIISPDVTPSAEVVQEAVTFFTARELPFVWWADAGSLEDTRFQFAGNLIGVARDISQGIPDQPPCSSRLAIKLAQSDAELQAFAEVADKGFGMPPNTVTQFQAVCGAAQQHGEQLHFVAYLDGTPVGAVTLALGQGSSAGIWNLATLSAYRKQGVGSALVAAALTEARRGHYAYAMAIVMPEGMAWGLLAKSGFTSACQFPLYVYNTGDSYE